MKDAVRVKAAAVSYCRAFASLPRIGVTFLDLAEICGCPKGHGSDVILGRQLEMRRHQELRLEDDSGRIDAEFWGHGQVELVLGLGDKAAVTR